MILQVGRQCHKRKEGGHEEEPPKSTTRTRQGALIPTSLWSTPAMNVKSRCYIHKHVQLDFRKLLRLWQHCRGSKPNS